MVVLSGRKEEVEMERGHSIIILGSVKQNFNVLVHTYMKWLTLPEMLWRVKTVITILFSISKISAYLILLSYLLTLVSHV